MATGWLGAYAPLRDMEPTARGQLAGLTPMRAPAGTVLFAPGAPCAGYVLVLEGQVRVSLTSESGRALTLYRVGPGQTCIQTTLCATGGGVYSAEGVAETDVVLTAVPLALFDRLLGQSTVFRRFVFSRFGERLAEMTHVLETIAFVRVDARLAAALLARSADGAVKITHQEMADEIGSAREVISRQLHVFAQQELVALRRGTIAILDRHRLSLIAQAS